MVLIQLSPFMQTFYQLGARFVRALCARPAGPKIAFMVFICVCVRPQLSRALSMSFHYYATIPTSAVEATGSLQAQ